MKAAMWWPDRKSDNFYRPVRRPPLMAYAGWHDCMQEEDLPGDLEAGSLRKPPLPNTWSDYFGRRPTVFRCLICAQPKNHPNANTCGSHDCLLDLKIQDRSRKRGIILHLTAHEQYKPGGYYHE